MANTIASQLPKGFNPKSGQYNQPKEEPTIDEMYLINRWEKWNKMALINTRKSIKKANADLKTLNLEKDLIRNIKKKFKS